MKAHSPTALPAPPARRAPLRSLRLWALFALLAAPAGARAAAPPVALVVGLRGEAARFAAGDRTGAPLRLFDKLAEGTAIETRAGAEVRLLFARGGRFAVGPASRVRLGAAEPVRQSGTLTALARLPAALSLTPISPEDEPGDRFPVVVIRAQPMTGVYPRGSVTLPAGAAVLEFDPVPGTERYAVVVYERSSGAEVFRVETRETRVPLAPGTLQPGTEYRWSVATVGRIGPRAEGKGGFVTYTPEGERARATLDSALAGEPEGEALLVKAAVDLNLGRYREAYEELARAEAFFPGDETLKSAIAAWRRRLELDRSATPSGKAPSPPPP